MRVSSKLSPIKEVSNEKFEDIIENAYEIFRYKFMDKNNRPTLFDKFIFIDFKHWVHNKADCFWHLVSLHETEQFGVFPCENNISESICKENCISEVKQVRIKNNQLRDLCIFRMLRIEWVMDIVKLADRKDENIKVWIKDDKLHIRFQHEDVDYVVILLNAKNRYQLISAFPVFYINKKKQFDTDYNNYIQMQKNQ